MAARTFPRIAEVRAYIQESSLPGGPQAPPRNSVEAHETTAGVHGLGRCECTRSPDLFRPAVLRLHASLMPVCFQPLPLGRVPRW